MPPQKSVLDAAALRRTLVRIAHEIVEKNAGRELALVGIHTRGAPLAARLHRLVVDLRAADPALGAVEREVALGDLDIGFYRDDLTTRLERAVPATGGRAVPEPPREAPVVHASHLDFALEGRTVVLVDDVLFTGRTIRAGVEALFDYGRPDRVQLAVVADRGHRELPIRPDFVGKNLPTAREERVAVRLAEIDGRDEVVLIGAGRRDADDAAEVG